MTTFSRYVTRLGAAAVVAGLTLVAPVRGAANNDANAGTWSMIALSGPTQIPVAAPSSTLSIDYQAELSAIKNGQAHLTAAQKNAIDYWSGGGVVRWNQILIELVARADLPPAPNADGTYPAPDANNPFADPNYPFSNPPYAARACTATLLRSAVRGAEGGVCIKAYLYNRPAPSQVDNGVQCLAHSDERPAGLSV